MIIDDKLKPSDLRPGITRVFDLAAARVRALDKSWNPKDGTPVFTVKGRYTSRGWTEWTQGFQYGSAILVFDATGDRKMLELGRRRTVDHMLPHVTHTGVHDHGFNNLSTYGNLRRLMIEGRIPRNEWELRFYETAIKASGAVQAARWSGTPASKPSPHSANSTSLGYIYSFNGPHSLFVDTMRTIRILALAWRLGHVLMHENDRAANLLKRCVLHGLTTSQFILFHGDSSHTYDLRGRTAHEAVFNRNDGSFRTRATQQGYSPFSTWTRGLAWAMLGYAEELEFFDTISPSEFLAACGLAKSAVVETFERCATETCDHYLNDIAAADGVCYWDDGAPGLARLGDWREKPADPFNDFEPVDSSASAIAAQGLIRLGRYLGKRGRRYTQAGLTLARTLMAEPYLSTKSSHQGLLLHSVYHRPNGWDYVPPGSNIPCGESSMWGDYHLLELTNLIKRLADKGKYPTFFA
ncbi:MAG: glycosyl hydrolase [Planctomycetes bacterium]|nr:glycosyl hydrolase [Planctomycetota bacterium]